MCMALHQQFYSLMHDPAVSIIVFINAILLIIWQPRAIGHKPDDLEISNKLLIGLNTSWAPIHTALLQHEKSKKPEIKKITSALKQFEVNGLLMAVPGLLVKVEKAELSLTELALHVKLWGGGSKKGHQRKSYGRIWRIRKRYIGDVVKKITW